MHAVPWAALLYTHMYAKLIKQCVSQCNSSAMYTEGLNGNVADVSMCIVHEEVERTFHKLGKGEDYTMYIAQCCTTICISIVTSSQHNLMMDSLQNATKM